MVGCSESYALIIDSTEGGNVTVPGEGVFVYDEGTVVNLIAEAEEGYRFTSWTGDVDTVADGEAASTNITVDGSYFITASFVAVYDLTLTSTVGGNVTTPGEGEFNYDEGTVVNLVAEADECYRFVNWTGDVAMVGNVTAQVTTITMNDVYSVLANFEDEPVVFPDANLEAAIREAIGKPTGNICPSDLEGLTILNARSESIADLTGLEHCTGLRHLHLGWTQISDISPLAELNNLRYLGLEGLQLSDISPLADLSYLKVLSIQQNQITDISPLANTDLTELYIYDNLIADISPLANLTKLTHLDLNSNQISDVSALAELTGLTSLHLQINQIGDIYPLVQNAGLGTGDVVHLASNPLNSDSINIYIPELQGRGVTVYY